MTKFILPILVLVMLEETTLAQPCSDSVIMRISKNWHFSKPQALHTVITASSSVFPAVDRKAEQFKSMYTGFYPKAIGGEMFGSYGYAEPSDYIIPGIAPYYYQASLFPFWCNKEKNNEMVTNIYFISNTVSRITVNDFMPFLSKFSGEYTWKGKEIKLYHLPELIQTLRGHSVWRKKGLHDQWMILLHREKELPYKILTRKEYLEIIRSYQEKVASQASAGISDMEKEIKELIENARKEYTGEMRDMMVKELTAQLEQVRKQKPVLKEKLDQEGTAELDSIDRYLKTLSEAELNKPAIPIGEGVARGFTTLQEGGQYAVVINESYFKKSLPSHAAQFIILSWEQYHNRLPTVHFRKQLENYFPLERLRLLIDN